MRLFSSKSRTLADLRRTAPGRFVALTDGLTHVVEIGDARARPLLLVHGATVPHWEFNRLVPHLCAAGYRTCSFDFYGHGLSDRPGMEYDVELFVRQTLEVVEAVGMARPLTILGHSLGAAVAAAVAARRPAWAGGLVLVAPMLDFDATSAWSRVFALPGIGAPLMRWVGVPALERRRRHRYLRIGAGDLAQWFVEQARADGYADALASMFRARTLADQSRCYAALAGFDGDLLIVAGTADRVVPRDDVARVRALVPRHRYVEIAGAEHNLLLTHPERVVADLSPRL
ncbi:MAG: alpha/beta fold hydrolase [Gammaproteobacteria bacterium]